MALMAVLAAAGVSQAGSMGGGFSLRFFGNGVDDIDRIKIRLDDPANTDPGPPADVGGDNFTIEFWMRASAFDNTASSVSCGFNINWINGNIVMDRDRFNQDRKWGLSIAGGTLVWGVTGDGSGGFNEFTVCGVTDVLDDDWHHVAVQRRRSDGELWIFVDGELDAQGTGPAGDTSYPDDGIPGNFCGGPCDFSDPFLVFAAEKHDAGPSFPSYNGWLDEIRLSDSLRYAASFTPAGPFTPDADTVALYHLDDGAGDVIFDDSLHPDGPSDGVRNFGGSPAGPQWSTETPFGDDPNLVFADGFES